jgi:NAD(P) transhydrogenase
LLLLRCNRSGQPPQHDEKVFELVNIGRAAIDHGGSVEYFRDAVFNYPTLVAEAYKVAALDRLNRIS